MQGGAANPSPEFWNGRRVVVVGNTGFKGSWLSLWLHRLGATVAGLSLPPPTEPSLFALACLSDLVPTSFGDIRDLGTVRGAFRELRPDIVFHLAAQPLVRRSYREPVETYATNVMGTVHVLEAVRSVQSVRGAIVVTSDKCYENREWPWAYRETEAMGGHDPYSSSKGCAELVTAAYRRSFLATAGVATARAGNVIGGGDWAEDRLLPDCMRALGAGEAIAIRNPHAVRPWQHVLEPLCGYLMLAERLEANAAGFGDAWNFGPADQEARPVAWIASRVVEQWGDGATWYQASGDTPHEAAALKVDAARARERLGWAPRLRLEDALAWTVGWHRRLAAGEPALALTDCQIARYCQLAS
ncbi:MAG TPA: CDP-glucose 4,6-dehydratase [Acetobacteraceae bacterium]|jgi:CDP-glucose 4,6-dehydratase